MIVTIREIVRYFRDYPEAERQFRTTKHGKGPRAWVAWHIKTWALPNGRPVWKEPLAARLWHWTREAMIADDWHLLARMSPDYKPPKPAPTPPPPAAAPELDPLMPPSQVAARILHRDNPALMAEWNAITLREGYDRYPSVIEFALANRHWNPGDEFRLPLNEQETDAVRREYTNAERQA